MGWLIPEWLLALSVTLFVLDVCVFQMEIPTLLGIFSLSGWLTWRLDFPMKWSVVIFILSALIFASVYYLFFRSTVGKLIQKTLTAGSPQELPSRMIGSKGRVHFVEGVPFLRWNGEELLPIDIGSGVEFEEGQMVVISAYADGNVVVRCQTSF